MAENHTIPLLRDSKTLPLNMSSSGFLLQPRVLVIVLATYLMAVHLLRYRRINALQSRHSAATLSTMSFLEAGAIVKHLGRYEFPTIFEKALQFALFRTYGIPTISAILARTTLLSDPATSHRRYTDTVVLIADFIVGAWGSKRWLEGLSRINCIHEPYRKSGSISNADMLYTLCLFMREPVVWINRMEWRSCSEVERCAQGVFWKGVGDGMNITYEELQSSASGKPAWRDGLHFYDELCAWADTYERKHMLPRESNHTVAQQTTAILLWKVPAVMKPLGMQAIWALMDARLRAAMMYPDPSPVVEFLVLGVLQLRALLLRHLALPRPDWWPHTNVTDLPDENGMYFSTSLETMPFYVKPTVWNRWLSVGAWWSRLMGSPLPGDDGKKYMPGGYTPLITGPPHGRQRQEEMQKTVEKVGAMRCPLAFG